MSKYILCFSLPTIELILLLWLWCTTTCTAQNNNSHCTTSSCGGTTIAYPFRLATDPAGCGYRDPTFTLKCRRNQTVLRLKTRLYHVQAITYSNFSIRLSDPGLDAHNYSSCPIYSSPNNDLYLSYMYSDTDTTTFGSPAVTFLNCLTPVDNAFYARDQFCGNVSSISLNSSLLVYSYVTVRSVSVLDLEDVCTYETTMGTSWPLGPEGGDEKYSYSEIHDMMAYGVEMSWFRVHCDECYASGGDCDLKDGRVRCRYSCYEIVSLRPDSFGCKLVYYSLYALYVAMAIGGIIGLRLLLGIPFLIAMVVKKWKTRHSSMHQSEINQEISQHQTTNFMPINYSYGEIKKMTKNFKSKLGDNLFEGKLITGPSVAIKMFANSSASDKEFISRVSKLSGINHSNVVGLVGFCIKGTERFVVHGPLHQKHTSVQEKMDDPTLRYGDMFKIAIGIARGTRCLHGVGIFDIRTEPRNVILDEELNPKILDCGLEKNGHSRMGLTAPEIFYRNVGEVSCKADVYGFGMVVLEMASRAKYGNKSGRVYFPFWVCKQLSEGIELEIVDAANEEERMMVRKMILVGLWCIQIRAGDRPPMSDIFDMLEGGIEKLGMPPVPFQRAMEDGELMEDCF